LAVIVIPIVRIIAPPGKSERSTEEKPVIVKSIPVEPTTVEPTTVKPAAPAVKAIAATVETSGVGGIWLAQRGSPQQSSCDCQSPSYPGPGSIFV